MSTSGLEYPDGPLPELWQERLKALWPNGDRLTLAWNLAGSLDALEDLLAGRYVDPIRLDQEWLRWARREQFVALKPALGVLNA